MIKKMQYLIECLRWFLMVRLLTFWSDFHYCIDLDPRVHHASYCQLLYLPLLACHAPSGMSPGGYEENSWCHILAHNSWQCLSISRIPR